MKKPTNPKVGLDHPKTNTPGPAGDHVSEIYTPGHKAAGQKWLQGEHAQGAHPTERMSEPKSNNNHKPAAISRNGPPPDSEDAASQVAPLPDYTRKD